MKDFLSRIYPIAIVAILILCLYNFWQFRNANTVTTSDETNRVFERVTRSGQLRVGYLINPPYLYKKGSSGEFSGIFYDVMEELGKRLNLKVVWVEEANLATISEGLDNNRYDLIAYPLWRSSERAKKVAFSTPLYYTPVGCYSRVDDNRFDSDLSLINSPGVKVSTIDGELAESIAKKDYPKAQITPLPSLSDYSQMLLQVATKKADVTFHSMVEAIRYMEKNPNTIKQVSREPIRVYAECYVLPIQDYQFQTMINETVLEMIENGFIKKAFKDNGESPDEYFMPATPYSLPEIK